MSGHLLNVIHCPDTRKVMRAALAGGWEWVGYTKSGHVEIRWPAKDAVVYCASTPSDPNSWKLFAAEVEKVSGIVVWRKGNRKRSRKNPLAPDVDVEAARRKHEDLYRRREMDREAMRQAENGRILAARQAELSDRRRREIEDLMRPGVGR